MKDRDEKENSKIGTDNMTCILIYFPSNMGLNPKQIPYEVFIPPEVVDINSAVVALGGGGQEEEQKE